MSFCSCRRSALAGRTSPRASSMSTSPRGDVLIELARGKDIPSGKLYEYIAARRPILAAVPPDGAAANLIRETGLGIVVAPDDVDGLRQALDAFVQQWKHGDLPVTSLTHNLKATPSRTLRTEHLC